MRGWSGISQKMVNKREIISPSLLYLHHHHSLSFFSLIHSSLPTLIPFSISLFSFLLDFPSSIDCFLVFLSLSLLFPSGFLSFPLFVPGVGRFGGVFALSSPGVLK